MNLPLYKLSLEHILVQFVRVQVTRSFFAQTIMTDQNQSVAEIIESKSSNNILGSLFQSLTTVDSHLDADDEEDFYYSTTGTATATGTGTGIAGSSKNDLKKISSMDEDCCLLPSIPKGKIKRKYSTHMRGAVKKSSSRSLLLDTSSRSMTADDGAASPLLSASLRETSPYASRTFDDDNIDSRNYYTLPYTASQARSKSFRLLKSWHVWMICSSMLVFLFTLMALTFQPLSHVKQTDVLIKTRTVSLFEFDLVLNARNPNAFPITLNETDLDVFASRGIQKYPSFGQDVYWRQALQLSASQELLGHVKHMNTSVLVQPFTRQNVTCPISIVDPSNTLGKFIYLTFPFTLLVRGDLTYSSPVGFVHFTIPICMYLNVFSSTEMISFSCQ